MPGKITGYGVLQSSDGSTVAVTDAQIPGDLRGARGDGVGFGPFRLTSWANSTTRISDLEFEEAEAESWLPFLSFIGVTGAAAHYDADKLDEAKRQSLTRRGLLVTIGASALFFGTASADGDEQTFTVATFNLEQNRRGLKVDIDERSAEFLAGEDVEFFLSADGSNVGSFDLDESGKTIGPGTTGVVELESDTALTFIQRLIAKVRADDMVVFEFRPRDESFAADSVGTEIELSGQPVVVETVDATDPNEVVIKMNGSVIPHVDDADSSAVGEWYTRDGTSLMYVTGANTPDTTLVEVRVNVGRIERLRENYL